MASQREDADADWVPDGDNDDEPAAPRRSTSRRSTGGRAAAAPVAPTPAQVQAQQQHMLQQAQAQYYLQQQAAQQAAHAAALAHAQEQGLPPPEAPAQMLDPETLAALQRQLQQQPTANIPVGPEIVGIGSAAGTPSRKRRIGADTDELEELDSFIDDDEGGEGGKKKKARKSGAAAGPRPSNPNPVLCDFVDETGKVCGTPFQRPYDVRPRLDATVADDSARSSPRDEARLARPEARDGLRPLPQGLLAQGRSAPSQAPEQVHGREGQHAASQRCGRRCCCRCRRRVHARDAAAGPVHRRQQRGHPARCRIGAQLRA